MIVTNPSTSTPFIFRQDLKPVFEEIGDVASLAIEVGEGEGRVIIQRIGNH